MIRCIAAIDSQRGIANDHGIPWLGRIPADTKYYRQQIKTGTVLMGYGHYKELNKPYPGGINYVATRTHTSLLPGFEAVPDARAFLLAQPADKLIWNLGGAQLYASTFDLADELYLTLLDGEFGCTKFFPPYAKDFELVTQSDPVTEDGISFCFTTWKRKQFTKQG